MIHIEGSKRLAIVWGLALAWLLLIMPVGIAQAATVTYTLDNVILTDGGQITGMFDWTFSVGDFEGGSGVFTALSIPYTGYSFTDGNLGMDIQLTSIEISGVGDIHDWGLDIQLKFPLQPLSPTQSSSIDLGLSRFECCGNGFKDQLFISGSISPNPVPIPAAIWLFGSGLIGLIGFRRNSKK